MPANSHLHSSDDPVTLGSAYALTPISIPEAKVKLDEMLRLTSTLARLQPSRMTHPIQNYHMLHRLISRPNPRKEMSKQEVTWLSPKPVYVGVRQCVIAWKHLSYINETNHMLFYIIGWPLTVFTIWLSPFQQQRGFLVKIDLLPVNGSPNTMTLDRMTVNRLEPGKGKAVNELATECKLLDHWAF